KTRCPLGFTEAKARLFLENNKPSFGNNTKCPKGYSMDDFRTYVRTSGSSCGKCPFGFSN
ncbi:unnamed protein product, partial [Brachionus calyciflorus]